MSDKAPEQKNGLLELLKNLWLPAAGFLGAVTLAYNFYQSWLGDQATITYFLGGGGLLVLLIALAWVGFKVNRVTHKILLPSGARTVDEKIAAYAPIYQRLARISLVIVFLGGLIGVGLLLQHRQALQEKLVVLIATFEGPEEVYGLRNEIIEKLNADFPNDVEVEIVKINEIITPDQGSPYARALGERYMADVVIWGWYRPTENPNITIHIENLDPAEIIPLKTSETLQPAVTLAELESFSFQQQAGQETSALISFLAGFIQYESGNYAQALVRFDNALSKIPSETLLLKNQAEIYSYRGGAHLFLDQYDQAISDFSKAIQINPQYAKAYSNRGAAYIIQKQYELAIADFSKAIKIDLQNDAAYNNRGAVYYHLKQYDQALADFSKAIQIDPQEAAAYINRGRTYADREQYEQAIADFSKAIQINPQLTAAYNNRGLTYVDQKQYEQAIADFSKAIQLDPQEAAAYNNRGGTYGDLKQYKQAIDDFSKAILLDPQDAIAYYGRASTYADQKQYEQAIADYSKAIQLDPQEATAYLIRGAIYRKLGKTAEAEADFAKYKELGGQGQP